MIASPPPTNSILVSTPLGEVVAGKVDQFQHNGGPLMSCNPMPKAAKPV